MIVADTSVWIDYLKGINAPYTELLDRELLNNRIITGDIIIVELLQGFKNEKEYKQAKGIINALEYHDFMGKEIAIRAAR